MCVRVYILIHEFHLCDFPIMYEESVSFLSFFFCEYKFYVTFDHERIESARCALPKPGLSN